jgi:hypothetical protein
VVLDLGGQGVEVVLRSEGPTTLDTSEGISEEDKMLLSCLEHVSHVSMCYVIGSARLTFSFSLRLWLCRGLG